MKLDPDFILDDQKRLCHAPKDFDEWDDDLMSDLCGEKLYKPIQGLLITLGQIKLSQDSFGVEATNAKAALEALMPLLKELRKVIIEEFNNV